MIYVERISENYIDRVVDADYVVILKPCRFYTWGYLPGKVDRYHTLCRDADNLRGCPVGLRDYA